ncbi:MAG: hypothetical protein K6T66_15675 [Peptococcaceae bacterium]|nr:hypothetical protein [Peptococcaceae bacterium]
MDREKENVYRGIIASLVVLLIILAYNYNRDTSLQGTRERLRSLVDISSYSLQEIDRNVDLVLRDVLEGNGYYHIIPLWKEPGDKNYEYEWERVAELLRERGYLVYSHPVYAEIGLNLPPGTLVGRELSEAARLIMALEILQRAGEFAKKQEANAATTP